VLISNIYFPAGGNVTQFTTSSGAFEGSNNIFKVKKKNWQKKGMRSCHSCPSPLYETRRTES